MAKLDGPRIHVAEKTGSQEQWYGNRKVQATPQASWGRTALPHAGFGDSLCTEIANGSCRQGLRTLWPASLLHITSPNTSEVPFSGAFPEDLLRLLCQDLLGRCQNLGRFPALWLSAQYFSTLSLLPSPILAPGLTNYTGFFVWGTPQQVWKGEHNRGSVPSPVWPLAYIMAVTVEIISFRFWLPLFTQTPGNWAELLTTSIFILRWL